jgi:hypothetical protein
VEKYEDFSGWYIVEKYDDFSGWYIIMGYLPRWSHCNGLPTQWKNTRIFQDGT